MSSFQLSSRLQALQEEGGVRGKEADGRLELTKLNLSIANSREGSILLVCF